MPALPKRKLRLLTEKRAVKYSIEDLLLEIELVEVFYGFREIGRVYKCKTCENYFLAERTDSKFCSVECGNYFRQRNLRDNGNEHLKVRRDRYRRNKELESERVAQKYRREI